MPRHQRVPTAAGSSRPDVLAANAPALAWKRRSCGDGAKGPRLYASETLDEDLIRIAGTRWAVEECFQTAKNEVGLDHYQVRRYDAWYRRITLVLCAHAYLAVTAAQAKKGALNPMTASLRSPSARSAVSWHT
ncbi:SRSO17 transposase [Micromonospora echinospora]|uniref:SRSO17 transposase n=1 Tax=Micromonospora echinospora TaxID=1877 RepID=A0ABR6MIK4_MICEC|nr:SRSO17 transposase [Micromonospora echinospora]